MLLFLDDEKNIDQKKRNHLGKKEGRKEGRKEGEKEARKEGGNTRRTRVSLLRRWSTTNLFTLQLVRLMILLLPQLRSMWFFSFFLKTFC